MNKITKRVRTETTTTQQFGVTKLREILRCRTGAGLAACKQALVECGNVDKAVERLTNKGLA